jgi:hypothetical protein
MPPATTVADTNNLGEGDSYLVLDLLSDDEDWMEKLKQEVEFKVMLHRGAMDRFVLTSIPFITSNLVCCYRGRGSSTGRSTG